MFSSFLSFTSDIFSTKLTNVPPQFGVKLRPCGSAFLLRNHFDPAQPAGQLFCLLAAKTCHDHINECCRTNDQRNKALGR